MFIPPKSFSLFSIFFLLVALLIPIQASSNSESITSAVSSSSVISYVDTSQKSTDAMPQLDDNDSAFVVAASSYMKRVNKNLSDHDARDYAAYIKLASEEYGVDRDLLLATIKVESRFNRNAVSPDGAKGLTQVIPKYHRLKIASASARYKGDIFHPGVNIQVGALILIECISSRKSLDYALTCYNGGNKPGQYARLVLAEYKIVKQSVG